MKLSTITLAILSVGTAVVAAQETPAPTPAMSMPTSSCWDVSVEGDATFCIEGPICSGTGDQPAGTNCPKTGDVATAECWDYVPSYADATGCVAPVDAKCELIETGAWGCVWNTGGGSMEGGEAGSSSSSGSGSGSGTITIPVNATSTEAENPEDITFPTSNLKATTLAAEGSSGSSSGSAGVVVAVVAAVAGIVCAVAAATYLRRKQQRREQVAEFAEVIETPTTGRTPLTPPNHDDRGFFMKTNV